MRGAKNQRGIKRREANRLFVEIYNSDNKREIKRHLRIIYIETMILSFEGVGNAMRYYGRCVKLRKFPCKINATNTSIVPYLRIRMLGKL